MDERFSKIILNEDEIQQRVGQLAAELSAYYKGKSPVFICVLKGAVYFITDLTKKLTIDCRVDFMDVSSYGADRSSSGVVQIRKDLSDTIENKDVVVVEDIFDTGLTMNYLVGYLGNRKPASIKICTLLDRPHKRDPQVKLKADFVGFTLTKSDFLVGYGLDDDQIMRNLPYIGVLKKDDK